MPFIAQRFFYFLFGVIIITTSCNQSVKKVKILPYSALHNDNSKVWILKKQTMNGEDVTPEKRTQRIVMTLYADQTFVVNLITDFAYYSENTGRFELTEGGDQIQFNWESGMTASYEIVTINESTLEYKTPEGADRQQHLLFVPIDKPTPDDLPETGGQINIQG